MKKHKLALFMVGLLSASVVSQADDIVRSSSGSLLDDGGSWDGGLVPGVDDIGVWEASSSFGTVTLGSDLSWSGMRISDLGASALSIGAGSILTLGADGLDMSASTADLTYSAGINLGEDQTWTIGAGRNIEFGSNSSFSGTGQLTLTGSGTTVIRTTSLSHSGGTVIDSSTLSIGVNGAFGTGGIIVRGDSGLNNYAATSMRNFDSAITFDGAANTLTLGNSDVKSNIALRGDIDTGAAQRTISIINSTAPSTGNIALRFEAMTVDATGGALVIANGNASPSTEEVIVQLGNNGAMVVDGAMTLGAGVRGYYRSAANFDATNADLTVNGILDLSNLGSLRISDTIKTLAGSGEITSSTTTAGTLILTIDGLSATSATTFSGSITNGSEAGVVLAVTKEGSTTQVLSGDNSYTGATQVTAGTLIINGDQSSATGNVTVDVAGILGGTGTVGGTTTVNGILSPGSSPGTLSFSQGLNINDGATYAFEGGDLVAVTGQLDLNDNWTLSLGSGLADGGSVVIFSYGTLAASPDLTPTFDISNLGFVPTGPLSLVDDSINNQIVLQGVSFVPEPTTVGLIGMGLSVVLFGFRRRRA